MSELLLESPFKYRQCNVSTANEKHSISLKEINKLVQKEKLQYIDIEILQTIYKFKYLNRYNIEKYINSNRDIPEKIKKSSYKKNLSKLMKYGLVVRYYFYWNKASSVDIYNQSPNFYSLSRGSLGYLSKKYRYNINIDDYMILESPENLMRKLSFNQVYVNIMCNYNPLNYYIDIKTSNKPIKNYIPGIFYFAIDENTIAPFVIFSVRRVDRWEQELINDLITYSNFMDKKNLFKNSKVLSSPIYLGICEDDLHIKEVHEELKDTTVSQYNYIFTTDITAAKCNLFEKIYMCGSLEGNTTIEVKKLHLYD
ncbi:hypothetical protein [Vallitalea guaymasensis]|uniref:hypothetical protein n=1 Tax=Vallitalea guaymasensis TaxID=1185412 RepID=UPI000DE4F23C|nr:hypothetical protein [Vallitalea guaymasensis]